MGESEFSIEVVPGREPCLRLHGDLDLESAPKLATVLRQFEGCDVVLECRGVTFLDSSGINVLVQAHNERQAQGRTVTLRGLAGFPLRALEICGLLETFGAGRS
jgi:anti-anti-sigma factor